MSPIKVLHVLDVEKEAHYFNDLVDLTDRNEVEFSFATFSGEGPFAESMRARGVRVYVLDAPSRSSLPRAAMGLWKILKAEDPDLVHTHLFNPTAVGLLLARMQKRKAVVTRHHSDALHRISNPIKRGFYLAIERLINRNAAHIIAPSQMVGKCIVEWEKTPAEKVSVLPYGQTSKRFDAVTKDVADAKRTELGMDKQLSLLCISRLYHLKGHKYLFDALAPLLHNGLEAKLYLLGSGDHRLVLEEYASQLGIRDKVEFLGFREDGLAITSAADIVVHPSLEDALSQALIESLMLGRPIVATDISGAADTLDGGKYGRIVPPADAASFRSALEDVIADLEEARRRAELGRLYILDYMDAKRVAGEYQKIYRMVLAN